MRFVKRLASGRTVGHLSFLLTLVFASACRIPSNTSSPSDSLSSLRQAIPLAAEAQTEADQLAQAEGCLAAGRKCSAAGDPNATVWYLQATDLAWQSICEPQDEGASFYPRSSELYHESLRSLIESAQEFRQLDPRQGIRVTGQDVNVRVPIRFHAFPWQPEDFNEWIPVQEYDDTHLSRKHQQQGWGVPLVVVRHRAEDDRFMSRTVPFAATALLRPAATPDGESQPPPSGHVLEVFNPLVVQSLPRDAGDWSPLAADSSAPIAWLRKNSPHLQLKSFLHPDRIRQRGQLLMLEPYQPGKIPVIFVHGLLSDPLTWSGLVNELRAHDWFNRRYQVWLYGYSTGRPFLRSAADLRHECLTLFGHLIQNSPDAALQRTVLVGHSMGGLITKLQVSHSDDLLWKSFADRPLDSLQAEPATRDYLSSLFFFEPLPFVERAVFIGTPHGGSPIARESIGRFASHAVSRAHEFSDRYEAFLRLNRGSITPFFAKHLPTSIDLLEPQDPCLQAMRQLRIAERIRLHSVIGTGHRMLLGGDADGVVPVDSARHADVDSELLVEATHRHVQSHPETVQELLRILKLHLEDAGMPKQVRRATDFTFVNRLTSFSNPVRQAHSP
jgi:pimeloyl-ACP methyl ester carboxylesterase